MTQTHLEKNLQNAIGIVVWTSSLLGHRINGDSCVAIKAVHFLKILDTVDW